MLGSKERVDCFPENIQQSKASADEREAYAAATPAHLEMPPHMGGSWVTIEKWAFREFHRKLESHFCPTNRPCSGGFQNACNFSFGSLVIRWHLGSGGGYVEMIQWNIPCPWTSPGQILSQNCSVLTESFSERCTQYVQHVLPFTPERKAHWPGSQQNVCFPFL